MIIQCPNCACYVDAKLIASHESHAEEMEEREDDDGWPPYRTLLLECIRCGHSLVTWEFATTGDTDWHPSGDVWWPGQSYESKLEKADAKQRIPATIRHSLNEARRAFDRGLYDSSVVMSGRAIEAVCRHFKTGSIFLNKGARELEAQGIIDISLLKWSEKIYEYRNEAAHGGDTQTSKEDVLGLADAICAHVFINSPKFEAILTRKVDSKPPNGSAIN